MSSKDLQNEMLSLTIANIFETFIDGHSVYELIEVTSHMKYVEYISEEHCQCESASFQ